MWRRNIRLFLGQKLPEPDERIAGKVLWLGKSLYEMRCDALKKKKKKKLKRDKDQVPFEIAALFAYRMNRALSY